MSPCVSVVIASFNDRHRLEPCLATLSLQEGVELRDVIVVDMASTDGTVEMLRERFPWVTLVPNAPNRGYGAAANLGSRSARGDWLLIANSDIELRDPGCLAELVRVGESAARPALVGASLVDLEGVPQRCVSRELPGRWRLADLFCSPLRYLPQRQGRYLAFLPPDNGAAVLPVAWFTGAALLIRRSLYARLGGFDEEFFMSSEEVDLCARVQQVGGTVLVARRAEVTHVGLASTPSHLHYTWLAQGAARYTRKHFGPRVLLTAKALAVVAYFSSVPVWLARIVMRRWSRREALTEAAYYFRALLAALRI